MTAAGQSNRWEVAKAIVEEVRRASDGPVWVMTATNGRPLIVKRISPISTPEYPAPARRPTYSVLSNLRLQQSSVFICRIGVLNSVPLLQVPKCSDA
jgi:dTDP-4-dehydrorhamnose reductase